MYCKIDDDTVPRDTVPRVSGESAQYLEMTSLDRIPARTETDANSTKRDGSNFGCRKVEDDTAVSLSDIGEEEKMWRSKGSHLLLRLSAVPSWKRIL